MRLLESLRLHAFGVPLALALLAWSVLAIRRRRLLPFPIQGSLLGWAAASLLLYWILRLIGRYAFGLPTFPAG